MKQHLCVLLDKKARELAEIYTNKAPKNTEGIVFELEHVHVTSELTGVVVLKKSNGQRVAIWLYWISFRSNDGHGGEWRWHTFRYDHLYGMQRLIDIVDEMEQENYKANLAPVGSHLQDGGDDSDDS